MASVRSTGSDSKGGAGTKTGSIKKSSSGPLPSKISDKLNPKTVDPVSSHAPCNTEMVIAFCVC